MPENDRIIDTKRLGRYYDNIMNLQRTLAKTMPKVLSPVEILAMPDGAQVWVEMNTKEKRNLEGWHTKDGDLLLQTYQGRNLSWTIGSHYHGPVFRVWSIQPDLIDRAMNQWPATRRRSFP